MTRSLATSVVGDERLLVDGERRHVRAHRVRRLPLRTIHERQSAEVGSDVVRVASISSFSRSRARPPARRLVPLVQLLAFLLDLRVIPTPSPPHSGNAPLSPPAAVLRLGFPRRRRRRGHHRPARRLLAPPPDAPRPRGGTSTEVARRVRCRHLRRSPPSPPPPPPPPPPRLASRTRRSGGPPPPAR